VPSGIPRQESGPQTGPSLQPPLRLGCNPNLEGDERGRVSLLRLDRGHARLVIWVCASMLLIFVFYSSQTGVLTSGLGDLLSATLGTVYPAFPFLALLLFLTAFRWKDFHRILLTERGFTSLPVVRVAGVLLILAPLLAWNLGFWEGDVYVGMELAAVSIVLVAYGTLLVINPAMWRIMLPYATLYAVGLVSPLVMLDLFSGALILVDSYLAAGIVNAIGIHVLWQGASFQFASSGGEQISAVVTAPCSAAYSVSIFLALMGLMYLDMRKSPRMTVKMAAVGVAIIPVLNSARIAITIWFGYIGGPSAFWGIHDWLGYAIFLALYLVSLVVYSRAERGPGPQPPRGPLSLK
jgi:exosortase/archaeosortase family protein